MEDTTKLPIQCPSCREALQVQSLNCQNCGTEVKGKYPLPKLLELSADDQDFILSFVKSSGSLKQMAKLMGRSYPSVRNRLDDVIQQLNSLDKSEEA